MARARRRLTHLDDTGRARMVDVSAKPVTVRDAVARGEVTMQRQTLARIAAGTLPKGDVLAVARLAGIMAAKRTAELIPLCHPLSLDQITVEPVLDASLPGVRVTASVRTSARTGVEMEALTAVAVACLAVYDMVKSADRGMHIEAIRLIQKAGGRSGDYNADAKPGRSED